MSSSKPTVISRENSFRRFNESVPRSQERRKLPFDEEDIVKGGQKEYHHSLIDSFRLPNPPLSDRTSFALESILPLARASANASASVADRYSAGNHGWALTPVLFSPAAGAAGSTASTAAGTLPFLTYGGLAGTSSRSSSALLMEQGLQQSSRMSFSTPFPNYAATIPFMASSRELTFRMETIDRLQKAIDSIPMINKIDFLAALQVAPGLVAKESDFFRFLRHANFDAKAAADKLVSYWKYRRSLFGDRAFRPMVMTGDGALTWEDIEVIKSGPIAYAPKDSEGCPVVILDASRRNTDTAQVRMRATFYHAQYLSEDSTTQTQGFVILSIVSVYRYDHNTMEAVSMLVNTFPVKVKAWHTFDCIKDRNSLEQGFLLGFVEVFLYTLNQFTTYLYSAETMEDVVWELATEHGLSLESIPDSLGGTWTYDVFRQWLIERMSLERNEYAQCRFDGSMSSESRRTYITPRPHKRSKWDEEEKSPKDDDDDDDDAKKPRADKRLVDSYDSECMEGLLVRFQKLLLHTNHEKSAARFTISKPEPMYLDLQQQQQQRNRSPRDLLHFYDDRYNALEKALQAISVHDKVDYMTAVHVAPDLVLKESDPSRFLAFHNYNAEKAAQGIVRYWKERRALFGERTFLPLTLTKDGALNAEDLEFQKCGNIVITGQDQEGSTVAVFDPARRTTDDRDTRIRAGFYMFQVLCENPVNQDKGFIGVHIIRALNYDKVMLEALPFAFSVFPLKLKAVHSFDLMTKIDLLRRGFVQGIIGSIVSAYTGTATFFHSSYHAKEFVSKLETDHGLPRTVVPECLGGSWSYDRFQEFWKERILLEQNMCYTLAANYAMTSSTMPSQTHHANGAVPGSITAVSEQLTRRNYLDVTDVKLPASIPLPKHQEDIVINPPGNNHVSQMDSELRHLPAEDRNNHVSQLDSEMRHLPAEDTTEYYEAVKNAPQKIWEDECCPEMFLRLEGFHARKAAIRLAKYWRLRSSIFGSSQYAALTQTGENALGRQELSTLATGFLMLLPNDIHGHSVLYIDPSLIPYDLYPNSHHRCIFYMMSLMTENEKTQSEGAIIIVRVTPHHFRLVNSLLLEALSKALPLRITDVHLISQKDVPIDLIRYLEALNTRVHVHSDPSRDALLSKLMSFGLTKAGLPKFVNGDWGYEKFFQWQELRSRIEWQIPTCLSGRDESSISTFPAMKAYTLLPLDQAAERKRRMSMIHFRRRQHRFRLNVSMLKEQCSDLQQEKDKLLRENEELEAKYAKATSIVSNLV